jgi:hypothetical protein
LVRDTNTRIHNEVDVSTGKTAFNVALLLRCKPLCELVETFLPTTSEWDMRELHA